MSKTGLSCSLKSHVVRSESRIEYPAGEGEEGEGEDEFAVFSAKRWDRRSS